MCNRSLGQHQDRIGEMCFDEFDIHWPHQPARFNIGPMELLPSIVRRDDLLPEASTMWWGFSAAWDEGLVQTNARVETIASSKMFKQAVEKRRCLVPADGFFEWQRVSEKDKRPFLFTLTDCRPFFLAGIYQPAREDRPAAFAVVTTRPNELMQPIHDRMPVILREKQAHAWLEAELLTAERLEEFATPYPAGEMQAKPVSKRANNVRNKSPDILIPDPEQPTLF
jgi:putative SOS response-associated peptidase YedK